MNNAIFNWSGGKDSAYALYKIQQEKLYDIKYLLTTVNKEYKRISMHGVREELLEMQAASIGIPLTKIVLHEFPSMDDYNDQMRSITTKFKTAGIDHAIFGDIFLEDLRKYREEQLMQVGMKAVFPLWKMNTMELVNNFIKTGFKAIVVCTDERWLDRSFAGKIIDEEFIDSLPTNVDPCGENGEFHSFVFDGPIFKYPIKFNIGEIVYKRYEPNKESSSDEEKDKTANGFWFCDLIG
jgi:uncharacterized protein (TIGR00290 family)